MRSPSALVGIGVSAGLFGGGGDDVDAIQHRAVVVIGEAGDQVNPGAEAQGHARSIQCRAPRNPPSIGGEVFNDVPGNDDVRSASCARLAPRADDNLAVIAFADAVGLHFGVFGEEEMDDAPLAR